METIKRYWMIVIPAVFLLAGGGLYWAVSGRSAGDAWDVLYADESNKISSQILVQNASPNGSFGQERSSLGTEASAVSSSSEAKEEKKEPSLLAVDVKGAVRFPGLYYVEEGARVYDVIQLAGKFTEEADPSRINLAEKVIDGAVVYVPAKQSSKEQENGRESPNTAGTQRAPEAPVESAIILPIGGEGSRGTQESSASGQGARININTAGLAELQTLPGIGPARAQAIIAYREKNGPFQDISELKKVGGIGPKTFEKLQEMVTVGR